MTGSAHSESTKHALNRSENVLDETNNVNNSTNENSSSRPSRTTDSIESSDSSGSQYNMRSRPNLTHKCPVRMTWPKINYTEHGMKDSSRDSNFEPVLKPPTPLDKKSHPTPSRITMQKRN